MESASTNGSASPVHTNGAISHSYSSYVDDNGRYLPTMYQQYIHISRYSRWLHDKGRRETWTETITRYFDFFEKHLLEECNFTLDEDTRDRLEQAILNLRVMPSMRCLMTAGEALRRENLAGYNCSYTAVDSPKAFAEILYILMCLHPDTLVQTMDGDKKMSDIQVGDMVLSYNERTDSFEYKPVLRTIQTPSSDKEKVRIEMEDGSEFVCTADHQVLTSNRGWVEAGSLTQEDDIVCHR